MDLYIDRDELSRGLARVQTIVERRSTHPLLAHVLLHAREGGLRMTATDTEVAFIGDLAANVEQAGEVAVDAASMFQVARSLPEATVRLTVGSGHRLELSSGRARFKLPGFPADEFPQLPAFDGQGAATLSERDLRRMVDCTHFAIATDDVRYGLNGVHLEQVDTERGPRLRFVATDGHRLAAAQAPFEGELGITPRTLVPRKAMHVMRKLLESEDRPVELSFGAGAIRLSQPGQTFWFRLLDGEFPDYRMVVPSEHKTHTRIAREVFGATLRRVRILVADRPRVVRFAFGDGELEIDVHNVDRGEIREALPIEIDGPPITMGFNVRFLQDALSVLRGDAVLLQTTAPLNPCLVTDPDDPEAFFIVMPMRLD